MLGTEELRVLASKLVHKGQNYIVKLRIIEDAKIEDANPNVGLLCNIAVNNLVESILSYQDDSITARHLCLAVSKECSSVLLPTCDLRNSYSSDPYGTLRREVR